MGTTMYKLNSEEMDVLTKKLDKLNKKGIKSNTALISIDNLVESQEIVKVNDSDGRSWNEYQTMYTFELTNINKSLGDFTLIASLDNVDGKNVVNYLLGTDANEHEEALKAFQYKVSCQHCGHNRKRLYTFVLQNNVTKEYIQVGRTCLKDFIGCDVSYLVQLAKINLDEIRKEVSASKKEVDSVEYEPEFINLDLFLKVALDTVAKEGFQQKDKGIYSTAYRTWTKVKQNRFSDEFLTELEKYSEEVNNIINWAKTLKNESGYTARNMYVIADTNKVRKKHTALASALIVGYRQFLNTPKPKKVENFLGEKGTKTVVELTVCGKANYTNRYGDGTAVFMKTNKGENVTWFTTTNTENLEVKTAYKMALTVKDYNTYNNEYVCYVKSVKMLEVSMEKEIMA